MAARVSVSVHIHAGVKVDEEPRLAARELLHGKYLLNVFDLCTSVSGSRPVQEHATGILHDISPPFSIASCMALGGYHARPL